MNEQCQHEAALETAAMLLAKKSSLQVWHIPDWVGDYHENTDEPDDFAIFSDFSAKLDAVKSRLTSQKDVKEKKQAKETTLQYFKYVSKEDLFDPEEYNPDNFPWYKTDDPNVDLPD